MTLERWIRWIAGTFRGDERRADKSGQMEAITMTERSVNENSPNSTTAFAKAPCHVNRLSATMIAPAAVCFMAGATTFLTPLVASAQERSYEWGWGMHPMWAVWGAGGVVMMVMMLAFWGVVIVSPVLGIRWLIHQRPASRSDSALEIVRQRYARGEINREEFEAKKRDLT
jgi:putative membrane protein